MNSEHHLLLNMGLVGLMLLILYSTFQVSVHELNLFHLAFAVYLFSNLPDIDSSSSRISRGFFFIYLALFLYGVLEYIRAPFYGLSLIAISLGMGLFHLSIRRAGSKHRRFPHTFTFGFLASGVLFYYTSLAIAAIGLFCFVLHLVADSHVTKALKKDVRIWTGRYKKKK